MSGLKIVTFLVGHRGPLEDSSRAGCGPRAGRCAPLQYTNQYNMKAKHKAFEPDENVIVLYPTSSNKLIARWHGPCTILEKISKYSYLVDMGNECHKIIHANKIRKYVD